ncbi:hypothetical protein HY612_06020 [Candidatus Roizmanbacteria bacterium]|nr:hypothetical protein [Candidatus Roizmanbacteria bacterium]
MKLPFFTKRTNEGKTFFGLFLKEKEGIGLLMKMEDTNVILVDQEKFTYSNGWEHLAEDIDELILKLEKRSKVQLHETIFFVYSHFIDEKTKEIKKPYLEKIKELVKSLNLKALGYIECYEAVIHYIEKKEELPLTAVLIELDHSNFSVFVYKRGGLTYSKVLAHTDNLIDDLLTSFLEIKGKFLLPSRIILYNSKDLDNEATEIVTYRWSEELFIQLPRVEIIKEHEIIQGLLAVFGQQFNNKITGVGFGEKEVQKEVLGFVIGGDVTEAKAPSTEKDTSSTQPRYSFSLVSNAIGFLLRRTAALPRILRKKLTVALGIIFIITGLFLNEYFFHKASLTLFLPSQTIKKDLTLTSDDLIIEATTKTADLTDSIPTSGKKDIGEKASGSVTIHNFDDKEKTFVKGDILETGGFKFSLDQEIKVASASVVTINGGLVKQPGKAKVSVTAHEIGPQSNLSTGKQFKISDFPTALYFGLNEGAFSGGTKREVKTVARKDMEDLKKSLQELAKKQKLDQIDIKKSSDRKTLPQLTEINMTEEKFDKELGEESDKLNLQSKVRATVYSYKEKELTEHVIRTLEKQLKKGFTLERDRLSYTVEGVTKKDNKISINIASQSKAIKELSTKDIAKQIRGKSADKLETLLKNNFKVQGFQLDIEPKLPILQNWMPFFGKNINLRISSL